MKFKKMIYTCLLLSCFVFCLAVSSWATISAAAGSSGGSSAPGSSSSPGSPSGSPGASPNPSAAANNQGGGGGGFSIESEMFAYQALETNSEAIACDIAKYLYSGASAAWAQPNEVNGPCSISPLPPKKEGIVIISSSSTALANYQLLLLYSLEMNSLLQRAKDFTCPSKIEQQAMSDVTGAVTTAVGALQSVLALFHTGASAMGVSGTIGDQALMDGVGRQLRGMSIPVLMPDVYSGLTTSYNSPFLVSFGRLISQKNCLEKAYAIAGKDKEAIKKLLSDIENFEKALTTMPTPTTRQAKADETQSPTATQQSNPSNTAPPIIIALLNGDMFAHNLGDNPSGWKILSLKALESGGSVITKNRTIGPDRVLYTGGAVATYSLFNFDGDLTCSGNVFDYVGLTKLEDMADKIRYPNIDPKKQMIFLRGGCSVNSK